MKILIACGGTGGHILPALRLAEELKLRNLEFLLVISGRSIEKKIIPSDYKFITLNISPLKLSFSLRTLNCFFRFIKAILKSLIILLNFRPDTVVGFGGYASFFLVFFAHFLRIKTIIHEENVIMGKANRLLLPFVDLVSLGFKETEEFFPSYKNKMVFTTNPLRKTFTKIEKKEAISYFGFNPDHFTILVMGGSQGSHKINMTFLQSLVLLKEEIQIIHLSGESDYEILDRFYKALNKKAVVFKFLDNMHYAFCASDLVICRAGAMTITELIFFELPAIIIPYPYAGGHQIYNANILVKKNCAILIEEKTLDLYNLSAAISHLIKEPQRLSKMRSNYKELKSFNPVNLWDLILNMAN